MRQILLMKMLDNTVEDTTTPVDEAEIPIDEADILVNDADIPVEDADQFLLMRHDDADENIDNTFENTDNSNGSILLPLNSNVSVEIHYNESRSFQDGGCCKHYCSLRQTCCFCCLKVSDEDSSPTHMVNINDTTWYCEYEIPECVNDAVNVTVLADDSEGKQSWKD